MNAELDDDDWGVFDDDDEDDKKGFTKILLLSLPSFPPPPPLPPSPPPSTKGGEPEEEEDDDVLLSLDEEPETGAGTKDDGLDGSESVLTNELFATAPFFLTAVGVFDWKKLMRGRKEDLGIACEPRKGLNINEPGVKGCSAVIRTDIEIPLVGNLGTRSPGRGAMGGGLICKGDDTRAAPPCSTPWDWSDDDREGEDTLPFPPPNKLEGIGEM